MDLSSQNNIVDDIWWSQTEKYDHKDDFFINWFSKIWFFSFLCFKKYIRL